MILHRLQSNRSWANGCSGNAGCSHKLRVPFVSMSTRMSHMRSLSFLYRQTPFAALERRVRCGAALAAWRCYLHRRPIYWPSAKLQKDVKGIARGRLGDATLAAHNKWKREKSDD